jgi:hypothetical protein
MKITVKFGGEVGCESRKSEYDFSSLLAF